jgi:hypothetical protein
MNNLQSAAVFGMLDSLLPTPRANKVNGCDLNSPMLAERNKSNLEEEIAKMVVSGMLQTPRTSEQGNNANVDADSIVNHEHLNLETVIGRVRRANGITAAKDGKTFRLSPLFTQEMMGFPFGWTELPFLSESGAPKPSKPTAMQ